uniref:nifU-like protein 1, chloroplastic n=1 Tax=Erigeron canadensis TaxID=72917 RepID=UPI001CB8E51B|nr:nifU-like protein 1, chloroplastic [Erigeron canadensis]
MAFTTPIFTSQSLFITKPKTQIFHSPLSKIIITRNTTKSLVGQSQRGITVKAMAASGGLYSAQQFELTPQNVDTVLDDVRPYLIADGGNVDVVSVENGVVSLKLQGACGTCPSSTTTMKMGIERVLKEKFGDALKDIVQVFDEQPAETTVEAVNRHLDILRPAITNFGGNVDVLSVEGGECVVKYTGPESIGSGIKAAIKEKFPDIENVVLTE